MAADKPDFLKISNELAERDDVDVLLYNWEMERPCDRQTIELARARKLRSNVILIIVTLGGDANVSYRIARYLQSNYGKFTTLIGGYCKSAGALLAIGAHDLIVADRGELGPLDVQLAKSDDLWATSSGLTVMNAFSALQQKAEDMFEDFALNIKRKSRGQVTFKTAADIASKLTTGLFGEHVFPD